MKKLIKINKRDKQISSGKKKKSGRKKERELNQEVKQNVSLCAVEKKRKKKDDVKVCSKLKLVKWCVGMRKKLRKIKKNSKEEKQEVSALINV